MIGSVRRFRLLKWRSSVAQCDDMESVRKARLEAVAFTPLPDGFPSKAALATFGYRGTEDVSGAVVDEFLKLGFSLRESDEIVAAALDL